MMRAIAPSFSDLIASFELVYEIYGEASVLEWENQKWSCLLSNGRSLCLEQPRLTC